MGRTSQLCTLVQHPPMRNLRIFAQRARGAFRGIPLFRQTPPLPFESAFSAISGRFAINSARAIVDDET